MESISVRGRPEEGKAWADTVIKEHT